MQNRIESLTLQMGGLAALTKLPGATLALAIAHADDVLTVSLAEPDFEIDDLVLELGYSVLDREGDLVYAMDAAKGLTEKIWGRTPEDFAWLLSAEPGYHVWLAYETDTAQERVLMLIRV